MLFKDLCRDNKRLGKWDYNDKESTWTNGISRQRVYSLSGDGRMSLESMWKASLCRVCPSVSLYQSFNRKLYTI